MKVSLLQENLQKAVSFVSKIVNSKAQIPVLSNILLEAEKTKFSLSSTNLEISFNIQIPSKIEKQGRITLPAKSFLEIVSSLPAQTVVLEQQKDSVSISCAGVKAKLKGLPAKEFPSIPSPSKKSGFWEVKAEDFIKSCSQVCFAASSDETRPVLAGTRLRGLSGGKMEMVATDGYRLSRKLLTGGFKKGQSLIVPVKALEEISRSTKEGEKVKIFFQKKENQAVFVFQQSRVVVRLIEGELPSFEKIIAREFQTEVLVDKEALRRALKIAAVFARESANIVRFKIQRSKLKVSANAPQLGENETEVEVKTKGEETEIAFNFRFVSELLNAIGEETVCLKLNGGLSPAAFVSAKDASFLHIIMPVRVQKAQE